MSEEYYGFIKEIQRLNSENDSLKRSMRVWIISLYELYPGHALFMECDDLTKEAIEREIKRKKEN